MSTAYMNSTSVRQSNKSCSTASTMNPMSFSSAAASFDNTALLVDDVPHLKGPVCILRWAGLCTFRNSTILPIMISSVMIIVLAGVLISMFLSPVNGAFFHRLSNAVWMIHSTTIYVLVAYDIIFRKESLVKFMHTLLRSHANELFSKHGYVDSDYDTNVKRVSWLITTLVALGVIINLTCVSVVYLSADGFYTILPLTRKLWFTVFGICFWYFYSYGWFLSMMFICIPSYALVCRAKALVSRISASRTGDNKELSVAQLMDWYDELHGANKLLVSKVSLMTTVNIGICAPLTAFLLESFLLNELPGRTSISGVIWVGVNIVVLLLVSCSVASVYAQNERIFATSLTERYVYRILLALGDVQAHVQFDDSNISAYQMAILKVQAIPLGVPFYGTRQFITFNMIIKVSTAVASFFLFVVSVSNSKSY